MRIAIVHYHLRTGGVSQVIASASRELSARGVHHVILVGEAPDGPTDLPVRVVTGLDYGRDVFPKRPEEEMPINEQEVPSIDAPPAGRSGKTSLPETLRAAAADALGGAPDIWHFHNHSLGKNPLIADVVARLAEENERLVLHIHDLAEDGRPENYRMIAGCRKLHPVSPRVHHVFLNARDREIFIAAGLPEEHASVLANPIPSIPVSALRSPHSPIVFAPVRCIRRKNPGEMVLLSALAPEGSRFAVSRAPSNPAALAVHDAWKRFAIRHSLPIDFDVSDRIAPAGSRDASFESWVAHATHFISTSVAEGFGMTFLEAAAHRKPLIARNLEHVTREHERHGFRSGDRYDAILIPEDWITPVILREHVTTTLERNHRAYGRALSSSSIEAVLQALNLDGWLDFGNLPEPLQQGVIERIADPASQQVPLVKTGDRTTALTVWLASVLANREPSATTEQLAPWSPSAHGDALLSIYRKLADAPAGPVLDIPPAEILTKFLAPASFHFLLSAPRPVARSIGQFRAVVFDIYGTLLAAPAGGVKPDTAADRLLGKIIERFGLRPPESPSTELHAAVLRHHAEAGVPFPEVDLRALWREILSPPPDVDLTALVIALEDAWHPAHWIPGAADFVRRLSRSGVSLGLLSNAQCNTLHCLGEPADLFAPELAILSYQHGIAKPSPALFETLIDRLAARNIAPGETLFIGNDPLHDIVPAAAAGFRTALFTGHPDSLRPGECAPDLEIRDWRSAAW